MVQRIKRVREEAWAIVETAIERYESAWVAYVDAYFGLFRRGSLRKLFGVLVAPAVVLGAAIFFGVTFVVGWVLGLASMLLWLAGAIAIVAAPWAALVGVAWALGWIGDDASPASSKTTHASFCDRHACIPSFYDGNGSIVECEDGMWSHSGGSPGACSYHGGER
jgi:hypothetical protein